MGIATGLMGWSPDKFWHATPHEFWSAWEAWKMVNEAKDGD